jgi:hypothetical protein
MEKFINCGESDAILVVAAKDDHVSLDVFAECMSDKDCTIEQMQSVIEKLSIALMALVDEEIRSNKILKTKPILNVCRYLVQSAPELVLDDDSYYFRMAFLRVYDAIKENKDATTIKDAFMDVDVEEGNIENTFQFQIVAESDKDSWIPETKTQIIRYED